MFGFLQIRQKEADIDALITPIEDMYSLLLRYEVRLCKPQPPSLDIAMPQVHPES